MNCGLDEILDARDLETDSEQIAFFDREVAWCFGRPLAVMVTDTVGMSKLTKEKGITEVLSRIRRMRRISKPYIEKRGATLIKTVADDMYIVHPSVCELYELARELIHVNHKINVELEIGIDFGEVLEVDNDLWGDAVNVASRLGEDIAGSHQILLSRAALDRVPAEALSGGRCPIIADLDTCEPGIACVRVDLPEPEHLRIQLP